MDDEIKPQSAIGAALEQIDCCDTVDELVKTSAELADIFQHNDEVLEFLHEQSVFALDRLQPKKPVMSAELFRKLMGDKVADA